jgi:23S rRNA (guanosine2251-2'-O)-methyltransferase
MKKRGHSRIVVFGRRAVVEALAHSGDDVQDVQIEELLASRELPASYRKELSAMARAIGVDVVLASPAEVRALSGEPRHDQGVAATIRLRRLSDVPTFLSQGKGRGARSPRRLIALDGVTNSQNIGMIVRSAVAAGMDGMLWPLVGSPWINGLTIKASAGLVYRATVIQCETLAEGLHQLAAGGFEILGLSGGGEENLFDVALPHRAVFVVGNETTGLSPTTEALLDKKLSVPMAKGVDSLNVAVAASLACFKATGVIGAPVAATPDPSTGTPKPRGGRSRL